MTKLEQAFAEVTQLPQAEQDAFAEWILAELHSEQRWTELFAQSEDVLSALADEALAKFHIDTSGF